MLYHTVEYFELISKQGARKEESQTYARTFTMRFSKVAKTVTVQWIILTAFMGLAFCLTDVFLHTDLFGLAIFAWVATAFFIFYLLYQSSYRCHVTEEKIVRTELWLFKKEIDWKCVSFRKIKRDGEYWTKEIVLYNSKRKFLISFSSEMVGYTNMEKALKRKHIPPLPKRKK